MGSTSSTAADLLLLQRIVGRDQAALAELYDRHARLLFSLVMRILRNQSDAEEVLQEAFTRVWTRATSYDDRLGSPTAWLTRVARNLAIDRFRARRARGDQMGTPVEALDERLPAGSAGGTSEHEPADVLLSGSVRAAIDSLPGAQRALIEAAFFEGYTHQELAERFSLPLGTVKTRIRTGLMTLRDRLEHAV